MTHYPKRVYAEFGPETRFELTPAPPAPFWVLQENRFESLKAALLGERLAGLWTPELGPIVRRAANEAAALAWVTPYPLLVFPLLFEERTEAAVGFAERRDWAAAPGEELQRV